MSPHWTTEKHHRGQIIRIADVPPDTHVLIGHTFEDCVIQGPAVLMFTGGGATWDQSHFTVSTPDSAFWELPARKFVKPDGVIAIDGCTFRRCRFERVSLAASANDIKLLRASLLPVDDLPQ